MSGHSLALGAAEPCTYSERITVTCTGCGVEVGAVWDQADIRRLYCSWHPQVSSARVQVGSAGYSTEGKPQAVQLMLDVLGQLHDVELAALATPAGRKQVA